MESEVTVLHNFPPYSMSSTTLESPATESTQKAVLRISPADAVSTIISYRGMVTIGEVNRNSFEMSMDEIGRTQDGARIELVRSLQSQLHMINGLEDAVVVDEESL